MSGFSTNICLCPKKCSHCETIKKHTVEKKMLSNADSSCCSHQTSNIQKIVTDTKTCKTLDGKIFFLSGSKPTSNDTFNIANIKPHQPSSTKLQKNVYLDHTNSAIQSVPIYLQCQSFLC